MPRFVPVFSQSSETVSSNQRSSSSSWPWNSIGIPGEVSTRPDPSTARFVAHQLSVTAPGAIASGTRTRPLATSSCDSV